MKRHMSSHALSVFVCTISSSLLMDVFRVMVPKLYDMLSIPSAMAIYYLNLPFTIQGFSTLLLASFLAMIWGMAFAHVNKNNQSRLKGQINVRR